MADFDFEWSWETLLLQVVCNSPEAVIDISLVV